MLKMRGLCFQAEGIRQICTFYSVLIWRFRYKASLKKLSLPKKKKTENNELLVSSKALTDLRNTVMSGEVYFKGNILFRWAAVHKVAQSWTRLKRLSMHTCIGEGNGNPFQCSCLKNPRDRGTCGLPSMGSNRIGQDWSDLAAAGTADTVFNIHNVSEI